jgi:hypothetical protein
MADPLATLEDVEARLGRPVTSEELTRIDAVLADVSARVRSYTGQQISLDTTTQRVPVRSGAARLPQRPVVDVDAVADHHGNAIPFDWDGGDRVLLGLGILHSQFDWEPWRSPLRAVQVTYTHGHDPVPDAIVGVVASIAARTVVRSPADAGVVQESIDGYSYTVGQVGAAGGFGLFPDERQILDRFRRSGGTIRVER